jgi:hypothetical protein
MRWAIPVAIVVCIVYPPAVDLLQDNWMAALLVVLLLFVAAWVWQFTGWSAAPRISEVGAAHQRHIGPGVTVTCRCTDGSCR